MIVSFKNRLVYSGHCDGLVYYWNKRLGKMIARRYVVPKESNSNRWLGAISRNLKALELSSGYIEDLKVYVAMHNFQPHDKCLASWRNAFLMLMFALAKADAEVDLLTITREQIESDDLPCISVKRAVEAGLLAPVSGYERLDNLL